MQNLYLFHTFLAAQMAEKDCKDGETPKITNFNGPVQTVNIQVSYVYLFTHDTWCSPINCNIK